MEDRTVLYRMHRSTFTIGGAEDDDVRIEGWDGRLLPLTRTLDEWKLKAAGTVMLGDKRIAEGDVASVKHNDVIGWEGHSFRVVNNAGEYHPETRRGSLPDEGGFDAPSRVLVTYLGKGGTLDLEFGADRLDPIPLTQRETRFLDALLDPATVDSGEPVPNDEIRARIWTEPGVGQLKGVKFSTLKRLRRVWADVDTVIVAESNERTVFRLRSTTEVRVEDRPGEYDAYVKSLGR